MMIKKKTKILFVMHSLTNGGITTSLRNLLEVLSNNSNLEIFVLFFSGENFLNIDNSIHFLIPSQRLLNCFSSKENAIEKHNIKWFILRIISKVFNNIIYYYLNGDKILPEQYDVAIAYENDIPNLRINNYVNYYVANKVIAKTKIAYIHNDPNKLGFTKEYVNSTYKKFSKIVCVSKITADKLLNICGEIKNKVYYAHNLLNPIYLINMNVFNRNNKYSDKLIIITTCRLSKQKRVDRIIDCCTYLKEKKCNIEWDIYGDGELKHDLIKLAKEQDVENILHFFGKTDNVLNKLVNSDIFVLSSDYEAYSVSTLEALAVGLPVITTNYEEAFEIIKNGKNGIIVEKDSYKLFEAIFDLYKNREKINKMKQYIKNNPISNDNSIKQFYSLIYEE